ncbi:MAG: GH36 C-terminal domain-containing protein, partial [Pirellulaceae bacterium]|nr:GH36 C-terminal domain-containing protein [Pirellulaceae bacterium]
IPPLAYWRANDAIDRQGITEIRHIEGYLRYWDELRRRHPNLRSDICSGGGSRNCLEGLRRAVPLWRSDYAYETTGMQTLTYGMSFWIPYFGTGTNAYDRYTFRSQMAPAIVSIWDMRRNGDFQFQKEMLRQWRSVADGYYGDYYPLTTYRAENDVWMAWQFNRPEKGEGFVQAFRRPQSPAVTMKFKLRGLEPEASYSVTELDGTTERIVKGTKLMKEGLELKLMQPRDAALIRYVQTESK